MLPRGDVQLHPYVSPAHQKVPDMTPTTPAGEQRVPTPPPLQRITDAPPIIAAPNPMAKRELKLTQHTHSRRTRNNIPHSVPAIAPALPCRFIPSIGTSPPIDPPPLHPQRSSRLRPSPNTSFVNRRAACSFRSDRGRHDTRHLGVTRSHRFPHRVCLGYCA
jgi:hypothetical protein